jgi:hypothetical protein
VRDPEGNFTTFDVPGAGTGPGQGTQPQGLNSEGVITGNYADDNGVHHGFVRQTDGVIRTFDAPAAGTAAGQGTFPLLDNPSTAITGYEIDGNGVAHGFIRYR